MTEKTYTVEQKITVIVDETKFDSKFMKEFRDNFYPFYTVDEHMQHLAELFALGMIHRNTDFIEGYGDPALFGINFQEGGVETYHD